MSSHRREVLFAAVKPPEAHDVKSDKNDADQTKQQRLHWLIKTIFSVPMSQLP